jgi:hypothetical protein
MKDKKLRLEDAINATRAAVEEGIVPGGGSTLTHLSENLVTATVLVLPPPLPLLLSMLAAASRAATNFSKASGCLNLTV